LTKTFLTKKKRNCRDRFFRCENLKAVVAIGSSVRTEVKADEFSDLDVDMIIFTPKQFTDTIKTA